MSQNITVIMAEECQYQVPQNEMFSVTYHVTGKKHKSLECGPMPNVMVALPNTGGALCSTPQSLADAHY